MPPKFTRVQTKLLRGQPVAVVDSCYNKCLYPFSLLTISHLYALKVAITHSIHTNTHEETGTKFTWHVNVYCCLKFSSFHFYGMLGVDVRDTKNQNRFFFTFSSIVLKLKWNRRKTLKETSNNNNNKTRARKRREARNKSHSHHFRELYIKKNVGIFFLHLFLRKKRNVLSPV